ncbi:hypothetical protein [Acetohalobium arabaticum]|uniref:Uncharacterized protein n=1 Tax=Acetohalobium arabaticum (strain ATCC 49924 / DSM 5501 / Z-7288) TaxID=574087 RepID=D9QRI3_ACEAZ|nr:hypothetical protein [Acetohalobium arabaticum]ADL13124.1 hypothetical protein Acear_1618 [Acetohalobium arabaticum DSM 5501]
MDGLTKSLSIIFAAAVFLLVAIITVANGLSLVIIFKRSLLSSLLFGVLGGVIGYLVTNMTRINKQQQEVNAVSQETAAQQYAAQSQETGEDKTAKDEFQPLDLEEIDYDEQQEVEELAEQDPEKLAKMVQNIQEE